MAAAARRVAPDALVVARRRRRARPVASCRATSSWRARCATTRPDRAARSVPARGRACAAWACACTPGRWCHCDKIVTGAEREKLAKTGALAVDMESAAVVRAMGCRARPPAGGRGARHRRHRAHAVGPPRHRALGRAGAADPAPARAGVARDGPISSARARSCSPRRVRSAPESTGRSTSSSRRSTATRAPIYVRRQIVHNAHVVADLQSQGAVFVDELDEVPDGTTVVFSAHGVAPAVRGRGRRAASSPSSTPPARSWPRCTPRPGGSSPAATPCCSSATTVTTRPREPWARHPARSGSCRARPRPSSSRRPTRRKSQC